MLTCSKVHNISSSNKTVIVSSRNRYIINIHLIGYFTSSRSCVSAISKSIIYKEFDLIRIGYRPEFVVGWIYILGSNAVEDDIEVHCSNVLTNCVNKSAGSCKGYYIANNISSNINPLISIIIHSYNGSSCRIGSSS